MQMTRANAVRHSQATWLAAKKLADDGVEPVAHLAAYERQKVVLWSAISHVSAVLRDARNVSSAALAERQLADYSARLLRLEGAV